MGISTNPLLQILGFVEHFVWNAIAAIQYYLQALQFAHVSVS